MSAESAVIESLSTTALGVLRKDPSGVLYLGVEAPSHPATLLLQSTVRTSP